MTEPSRKLPVPAPFLMGLAVGLGLILVLIAIGTIFGLTPGFYGIPPHGGLH